MLISIANKLKYAVVASKEPTDHETKPSRSHPASEAKECRELDPPEFPAGQTIMGQKLQETPSTTCNSVYALRFGRE